MWNVSIAIMFLSLWGFFLSGLINLYILDKVGFGSAVIESTTSLVICTVLVCNSLPWSLMWNIGLNYFKTC